jgi:hypothetical protein
MASRPPVPVLLAAALASLGASHRSDNFLVEAPTPQLAARVARVAEQHRKEQALAWLGKEMPAWARPCPIRVTVTPSGSGGATSFTFDRGQVLGQDMRVEGSLDRLLASVLPHEITHTVFAHHFRAPVPRWADEGGAILAEDDAEQSRHDRLMRQILETPGRAMPLRRLFALREYPRDVMVLYAEGHSVTRFLVKRGGRRTVLAFVADGMRDGWDAAVKARYRYDRVDDLEKDWLKSLGPCTDRLEDSPAPPTQSPVPMLVPAPSPERGVRSLPGEQGGSGFLDGGVSCILARRAGRRSPSGPGVPAADGAGDPPWVTPPSRPSSRGSSAAGCWSRTSWTSSAAASRPG